MRKILIILLLLGINKAYTQGNDCNTIAKGKPIIFSEKQKDSLKSIMAINQPYSIRVWVTVFADDNGTNRAATDADIRRQMQNMTNQFLPHNICFTLMGITQVNNTDLNTQNITGVPATDESTEVVPFLVDGNLNVFIHNFLPGLNGSAYAIPCAYLSVWGGIIAQPQNGNISTLGHEMGHCLGLYHTFEPWADVNGVPTLRENVARTGNCKNCTTNGDVLCDTPADDDGGVNSSCNYVGGGMDACNVVFTPMTNNMMGYGSRPCRNTFTSEQGERMRTFLTTNATLFSFLVNDSVNSPPTSNTNYSFSSGSSSYTTRDFVNICLFANNTYVVSGSATQTIVSKKITLKSGTRLSPSTGRVQITSNPYCQ
jgi:Pregnancy-associated plasma protein-A